MAMNSVDLKNRISPPLEQKPLDLNPEAKIKTPPAAKDSTGTTKTSFKDLMMNSNDDASRARAAMKNGNGLAAAKTDEEFAAAMAQKINSANARTPGNKLDKDAFLKLFITQVQNQDPLNPDKSSEMAAQLAQFDGLEQMLNINKTLEKMSAENQTSRAVNLVSFVGKELSIDNGKLNWQKGKLTDATMDLEKDVSQLTLEVRDSSGAVVSTEQIGQKPIGEHKLTWKGLDGAGKPVKDGIYSFGFIAKDVQGQPVDVRVKANVRVTGVDLKDLGGSFYTDVGKIGINEVASVGDQGTFGKVLKEAQANAGAVPPAMTIAGAEGMSPETIQAAMQAAMQAAGAAGPQGLPGAAPAAQQGATAAPQPVEGTPGESQPAKPEQQAAQPAAKPVAQQPANGGQNAADIRTMDPLGGATSVPFTGS